MALVFFEFNGDGNSGTGTVSLDNDRKAQLGYTIFEPGECASPLIRIDDAGKQTALQAVETWH